ncbi:MAG TPA: DUF2589 domain-containing protein [Allosphingosinicella sp.]|nr:DUF2589 domain-containing protein [Allosphingosinicella sp.]
MAGDFELHELIAAPILAFVEAQAEAAATFYDVLERFAFEEKQPGADAGGARRLRMIAFVAERAGADGTLERREIGIPLLQMIPLSGLGIDTARLQFAVALTAEPAEGRSARREPAAAAARPPCLRGRVAPLAGGQPAAGGTLQVEITLRQLDLPAGYLEMIAETQGGIVRPALEARAGPAGPVREQGLFRAALRSALLREFARGRDHELTLHIEPDRRFVGEAGLELQLASDPPNALLFLAPAPWPRLSAAPQPVSAAVRAGAAFDPAADIHLVLGGTARGADGIERTDSVRIPFYKPKG